MPNTKYVVAILYYKELKQDIKHLNTLYSSEKAAKTALSDFLNNELKEIRENGLKNDFANFTVEGDNLYYHGSCLMQGKILEVKEEEAEETLVDVLMRKYGEKHHYVSKAFLKNAYNAFCHHFSIDKDETEYGCGSLEKLTRILGKDFRDSDLLFLIAESFERIFDPEYSLVLKAWQDAIIDVVGEEKYEAAFEEGDITKEDILEIATLYKDYLGFSDSDIKHLAEDSKMINNMIIAINTECEDNEVLFTDLDMKILDINTEGILRIIKDVYEEFAKENPSHKSQEIFAEHITTYDLLNLITAFKNELDFLYLDIELIKADPTMIDKIIAAIKSYCRDNEVTYLNIDKLSDTDDIHFRNILIIIKNVYNNF